MIQTVLLMALIWQTKSPDVQPAGDWAVRVTYGGKAATLAVAPPVVLAVTAEKYDSLPVFNPNAGGWAKGARLHGVLTQETTTPGLLDPESLVVRAGPQPDSQVFEKGRDYDADLFWGTFGRLAGGRIGENQPVYASYRHGLLRLDSVVRTLGGKLVIRQGVPRAAVPVPMALGSGERRLANLWLPGRVTKLTEDNLFPVLETAYPEPPPSSPSLAERLLPKTMAKLRSGEPIRILAWGDSVTDAGYLPDPPRERWQEQFVARLRQRYPKARIKLVTEAWGGRNTASYLGEPPGSPHNYREKVLGAKPDLVVSEFVNDAGLNPAQVEERYGKLLADFQGIGAEWIILTPHYVRPDWMGLTRERNIDQDPRPYVAGLREFAAKHNVALADASLRWGRLWRQGIPYTSLLMNSINHPNAQGMRLFADSLMGLFPQSITVPASGTEVKIVESALKQIYAGRIDPKLLTPALRAKMTPARVKSLSASMHQYGPPKSPKLISMKQENGAEIATIRVLLGDTAFIVTAVVSPDNRLDDLKFIEE
jgi:lysophospholipase L1-like esterase